MILVLPPETTDQALREVVSQAERLGWSAQVSRGSEQMIVALEGLGEPAALEAALDRTAEVDVIPVLTTAQYRLRRSRRTVLTGLAAGLGLLTAVGAGLPVVGFLRPPLRPLGNPEQISGGSVRSLEPGMARPLRFRDSLLLLICLEPGQYVALSGSCTHMQPCRLDWDRERRLLVCPCHGGAFDVHGNVVRGPASRPIASYSVERVGDELFVGRN